MQNENRFILSRCLSRLVPKLHFRTRADGRMQTRTSASLICFVLMWVFLSTVSYGQAVVKPRVIVSTDIGGSDPDDFQSMVHYLMYADRFDTEGLVSSPPGTERKEHIHEVINEYEKDYQNLVSHSLSFPLPDTLRAVTMQGAAEVSPSVGYSSATEGSDWIIRCADLEDPRPLWILVWGSITDVAQAVHDAPHIKSKIRVYYIGSWNTSQDPNARNYLYFPWDVCWR